jgi:hypothetical protein
MWFSVFSIISARIPSPAIPEAAVRRRSCKRHAAKASPSVSFIAPSRRDFAFEKPEGGVLPTEKT